MSDFEIDFECHRAEYVFVPPSLDDKKDELGASGYLVRHGDFKRIRPTAKQLESAIQLLVGCGPDQLPKRAVAIANNLGGLIQGSGHEPLILWEGVQHGLRKIFAGKLDWRPTIGQPLAPSDSAQRVGIIGVHLIPNKGGRPRLAIRPENLSQALMLHAARLIATGTSLASCENCNAPFLRGGVGRKKKRSDAQFCSEECRWKHNNEMRRKAKAKSKS